MAAVGVNCPFIGKISRFLKRGSDGIPKLQLGNCCLPETVALLVSGSACCDKLQGVILPLLQQMQASSPNLAGLILGDYSLESFRAGGLTRVETLEASIHLDLIPDYSDHILAEYCSYTLGEFSYGVQFRNVLARLMFTFIKLERCLGKPTWACVGKWINETRFDLSDPLVAHSLDFLPLELKIDFDNYAALANNLKTCIKSIFNTTINPRLYARTDRPSMDDYVARQAILLVSDSDPFLQRAVKFQYLHASLNCMGKKFLVDEFHTPPLKKELALLTDAVVTAIYVTQNLPIHIKSLASSSPFIDEIPLKVYLNNSCRKTIDAAGMNLSQLPANKCVVQYNGVTSKPIKFC